MKVLLVEDDARLAATVADGLGMHDIDGLSLVQIQSVTGLPIGTIKSKLYRARVKLGRLLSHLDPNSAPATRTGGQ